MADHQYIYCYNHSQNQNNLANALDVILAGPQLKTCALVNSNICMDLDIRSSPTYTQQEIVEARISVCWRLGYPPSSIDMIADWSILALGTSLEW